MRLLAWSPAVTAVLSAWPSPTQPTPFSQSSRRTPGSLLTPSPGCAERSRRLCPPWPPLLGPWPWVDGLYLAVGFSGHGLKLAPAVGEAVADELAGRTPAIDISPLRPAATPRPLRFAYGPGARA